MRPASGPRPAPISMSNSSSRRFRTGASSTPSGHDHGVQRPQPLRRRRQQCEAELPAGRRPSRDDCGSAARRGRRGLPLRRRATLRSARRSTARRSCGDTCAGASSPRATPDRNRTIGSPRRTPHAGSGARGKRNRRQTRRRAQPLLRAAVTGVSAPAPDIDRVRAERRHRIDDRQRAVPPRDRADLGHGIQHARGRLGVHHRDDVGSVGLRARVRRATDRTRDPTRRPRATPTRRSARSICASRSPK